MEKQNVTIVLPTSLLRKAKILAAQEDKSISELLRESIEDKVRSVSGYREAKNRQLRSLRKGLSLGTNGAMQHSREELHERK